MNFQRSDRVSELLRHEISKLVQEINDPRLGFVTITEVRVSSDLTDAKIYFSVLGSEEDRAVSSEILVGSIPSMRGTLSRKLESLRRIPALGFVYDDTAERAQKVVSILNRLAGENQPPISELKPKPSLKSSPAVRIKNKKKSVRRIRKKKP